MTQEEFDAAMAAQREMWVCALAAKLMDDGKQSTVQAAVAGALMEWCNLMQLAGRNPALARE